MPAFFRHQQSNAQSCMFRITASPSCTLLPLFHAIGRKWCDVFSSLHSELRSDIGRPNMKVLPIYPRTLARRTCDSTKRLDFWKPLLNLLITPCVEYMMNPPSGFPFREGAVDAIMFDDEDADKPHLPSLSSISEILPSTSMSESTDKCASTGWRFDAGHNCIEPALLTQEPEKYAALSVPTPEA